MQTRSLKVRTERDPVGARLTMGGDGPLGILLAHGAGVGQGHVWMKTMRRLLAEQGLPVMTFDYAYTAQGRKSPDRMPRLLDVHRAAARRLLSVTDRIVFAGKSMGSRVGSHLADEGDIEPAGLVHYGYPLVPMGKGEPRPTDHLERLRAPQLFFAGTRDRLSPPEAIVALSGRLPAAEVEVIDDADHSFNVPKRSGKTTDEVLREIAARTGEWVSSLEAGSARRRSARG